MGANREASYTLAGTGVECPFVTFEDLHQTEHTGPLEHFTVFDELRREGPLFYGSAGGNRFWLPTRMADIRETLQAPAVFSSGSLAVADPNPAYNFIPVMLDPPLHTHWRRLLAPFFSRSAVEKLGPLMRQRSQEILDEVAPRGECDYVTDVALRFPNTIFMEIVGLPVSEWSRFMEWEQAILHSGLVGHGPSLQAQNEVTSYFSDLIANRRKSPRDDLISASLAFEIDGRKVNDEELLALFLLLFQAGLDTVASQLT